VRNETGQDGAAGLFAHAKGSGHGTVHLLGLGQRRELGQPHAVGICRLARRAHCQVQTSLAHAASTGEGQNTDLGLRQAIHNQRDLALAAHQRRGRERQKLRRRRRR